MTVNEGSQLFRLIRLDQPQFATRVRPFNRVAYQTSHDGIEVDVGTKKTEILIIHYPHE